MAGSEGWSRIVYSKDDRGVILDSRVVGADEETPEGFEESAEYESVVNSPTEGPPVDESRLTRWDAVVLDQTVDVIKGDEQEGPSQPGGESDDSDESDDDEPDETSDGNPPPQGGPGSGKEAWAQYAADQSVSVPEDASRDDIIAAVKAAGKPVA